MDGIPSLFETLKRLVNLTNEDFVVISRLLRQDSFEADSYVFKEGAAYNRVGFISKGLVKKFYLTPDGKEFIKEFSCEGEVVAPLSSLLQNKSAIFSVQALEPTVLLSIEWSKLNELFHQNIRLMELGKRVVETHFINRELRELEFLKYSAKERYQAFESRFPGLLHRLRKQDIASYLGITPVSLSRLLR